MKAEHRKELHTNLLADRMGRLIQGMKSPRETNSLLTWVFVVLAIGTFAIWQYFSAASQTESSALWVKVDAATHDDPRATMSKLTGIAQDNRGTLAGRTAQFELARLKFEEGEPSFIPAQRSEAIKSLKLARDLYEQLARECADAPLLAQEAMMGVAKANEALVGSENPEKTKEDLEVALDSYKQLAAKYPNSVLGKKADDRAKELEASIAEVAKFYTDVNQSAASKLKTADKEELP